MLYIFFYAVSAVIIKSSAICCLNSNRNEICRKFLILSFDDPAFKFKTHELYFAKQTVHAGF
jgi:hypothetical protein